MEYEELITEYHKFCPFCGNEDIYISTQEQFEKLWDENGGATMSIDCHICDLSLYEHSYHVRDYKTKREILIRKWNLGIPRRDDRLFSRKDLEGWLYKICLNNTETSEEVDFSLYVEEIINRLDGFEQYIKDKENEENGN